MDMSKDIQISDEDYSLLWQASDIYLNNARDRVGKKDVLAMMVSLEKFIQLNDKLTVKDFHRVIVELIIMYEKDLSK